jgi:hypothetical protein
LVPVPSFADCGKQLPASQHFSLLSQNPGLFGQSSSSAGLSVAGGRNKSAEFKAVYLELYLRAKVPWFFSLQVPARCSVSCRRFMLPS